MFDCFVYYTGKILFMFEGIYLMFCALAPEGPCVTKITSRLYKHKPLEFNCKRRYYILLLHYIPKCTIYPSTL